MCDLMIKTYLFISIQNNDTQASRAILFMYGGIEMLDITKEKNKAVGVISDEPELIDVLSCDELCVMDSKTGDKRYIKNILKDKMADRRCSCTNPGSRDDMPGVTAK